MPREHAEALSEEYGQDLGKFVQQSIGALHRLPSRQERAEIVRRDFAHANWVSGSQTAQNLEGSNRQNFNYMFPNFAVQRYLEKFERAAPMEREALTKAQSLGLSQDQIDRIRSHPMAPVIRAVDKIECTQEVTILYGCQLKETLLRVHAQIQPDLSCNERLSRYMSWEHGISNLKDEAQVSYILKVDSAKGFQIVDFEKSGARLLKTVRDDVDSASRSAKYGYGVDHVLSVMRNSIYRDDKETQTPAAQGRQQSVDAYRWSNPPPQQRFQATPNST